MGLRDGGNTFVFNSLSMEITLGTDGAGKDCTRRKNQTKCSSFFAGAHESTLPSARKPFLSHFPQET